MQTEDRKKALRIPAATAAAVFCAALSALPALCGGRWNPADPFSALTGEGALPVPVSAALSAALSACLCAAAGRRLVPEAGLRRRVFLPACLIGASVFSCAENPLLWTWAAGKALENAAFAKAVLPPGLAYAGTACAGIPAFVVWASLVLCLERPRWALAPALAAEALCALSWAFCAWACLAPGGLGFRALPTDAALFGIPARFWILAGLCAVQAGALASILAFRPGAGKEAGAGVEKKAPDGRIGAEKKA